MPYKIAHRGLRTVQCPENTLGAFHNALNQQWQGIEFDVQMTADGVPVVFHDDQLKRLCGVHQNIFECDWAQIQQYTVKGSQQKIPLLADVLLEFHSKLILYLEVKVPDEMWKNLEFITQMWTQIKRELIPYLPHFQGWMASFHPVMIGLIYRDFPQYTLAICEYQEEFDELFAKYHQDILYSLSWNNQIQHQLKPSCCMYWDSPLGVISEQTCLAWILDE